MHLCNMEVIIFHTWIACLDPTYVIFRSVSHTHIKLPSCETIFNQNSCGGHGAEEHTGMVQFADSNISWGDVGNIYYVELCNISSYFKFFFLDDINNAQTTKLRFVLLLETLPDKILKCVISVCCPTFTWMYISLHSLPTSSAKIVLLVVMLLCIYTAYSFNKDIYFQLCVILNSHRITNSHMIQFWLTLNSFFSVVGSPLCSKHGIEFSIIFALCAAIVEVFCVADRCACFTNSYPLPLTEGWCHSITSSSQVGASYSSRLSQSEAYVHLNSPMRSHPHSPIQLHSADLICS